VTTTGTTLRIAKEALGSASPASVTCVALAH
jgi:predicted amidophosphoribosyltransferase